MKKLLLSLFTICCCFASAQQVNFSRYLETDFSPVVDVEDYKDLAFRWNQPGQIQAFLNDALSDLKEKKFAKAVVSFDTVITLMPEFYIPYYYRGISNKNLGEWRKAENDFIAALKYEPKIADILIELAEVYQTQNKLDKAISAYDRAAEANPNLVESYYGLGNIAFIKKEERKALRYYQKCIDVDPKFPKSYLRIGLLKFAFGKIDEGLGFFDKAVTADSIFQEGLFIRGLGYLSKNNYEETLKDWNRLAQLNPGNLYLTLMRGFLYVELGDFEKAFIDLKKVLLANFQDENKFISGKTLLDKTIDLQFAGNYLAKNGYGLNETSFRFLRTGFCYLIAGKYKEGIKNFESSIFAQKSSTGFFLLGLAFEHDGNHPSAWVNYDSALYYDKDIFDAHKKRAIYRSESKDWRGAFQDFNEMLRIEPTLAVTYRLRGIVKYKGKDYGGGLLDLTKFINSDSTEFDVWLNRGRCRKMLDDKVGAVSDFKKALELNTNEPDIYEELFSACLLSGDSSQALKVINQYLKLRPGYSWSHLTKIKLFIDQQKWDSARAAVNIGLRNCENLMTGYVPGTIQFLQNLNFFKLTTSNDYAIILFYDGLIDFKTKEFGSSIYKFEKALKLNINHHEARYYQAKALIQLGHLNDASRELKILANEKYVDSALILQTVQRRIEKNR
jgi:tetratricopeptide (TPR) repeat protein